MTLNAFPEMLLDLLPLHAEEGRLRDSIPEHTIISLLDYPDSPVIVMLLRRIFESFSLLDKQELRRGNWAFVSFPAFLIGRSLVSAWITPNQQFVDEGYWEDSAFVEEQRQILHQLEAGRKRYHPTNDATPIRFVHVAWALIRFGNDFLLHHREDKHRPESKQYVLPGGRLRPSDYRGYVLPVEVLKDLFSKKSSLACEALPNTLIREIEEELGLQHGNHYTFEFWRSIEPYCAVEGGGNKHALTHYEITLYTVKLTLLGEMCLLRQIAANPEKLLFFTLHDLVLGKRPDGATAFIDAIQQDMGGECQELLASIPNSADSPYFIDKFELAIDLPSKKNLPFLRGKTGKEREISVQLNNFDWELILLLGWCARGFAIHEQSGRIQVLGGGWIRLIREDDVKASKETENKLSKLDLPILQIYGEALRLSIKPEFTYLSDRFYSFSYTPSSQEGGKVVLYLKEQSTRFAHLAGQQRIFRVPRNIAVVIETLLEGKNTSTASAIRESLKSIEKQNYDTVTKEVSKLGLRRLIRIHNNSEMFLTVDYISE